MVDRDVFRIGIDKANLTEDRWQPAAEALAAALALDDQAGFVQRVLNAGPAAYAVAITIRQTDAERYGVQALRTTEGVLVQEDSIPLAPTATFARPILGNVGEATAEIVEESEGRIEAGDTVGTSGLQRLYDEQLRGTPATRVLLTGGPAGDAVLYESEAVRGTDLALTLDTALQDYAETRLSQVESASAVVALEASTGNVLAAASGPGSAGLSTATVGQYAPGSTFKVATALALLRAGLTPDSPVECTPTVAVDGREFRNFPGYPEGSVGTITLAEAIAQSCNTALIAQHAGLSSADLSEAAASLGLGSAMPDGAAWPFPYFSGTVPTDASGTTHAADLIGQGDVLASPLAMAGVAASVAAGRTVTPTLVEVAADADAADATDDGAAPQPVPPAVALTPEEAQTLQGLMYGVVERGSSTFLQAVPGEPVGAKSGTAQFGSQDPPQTHAWMIAFQGDLAVAVLVEVGDYGTATAGPILQDVLTFAAESGWGGATTS
ncbi:penicillin-binding transpeptidase domain-containing protein [Serinibacter arcticus]|uniref:penicillin-binding transpeptidase domain-containing protein n=1 Tax=Serinibacter arcticus TaxID=1655435 RepID=UPI001F273570|nr:penicillin-binding transpeptidase domain-containing protein [Serinibacter arcticus]